MPAKDGSLPRPSWSFFASCASPTPEVASFGSGPPARPAGWHVIANGAGTARLPVPPDIGAIFADEGTFIAQEQTHAPSQLEVILWAPSAVFRSPSGGEPIEAWLGAHGYVPKAGDAGVTSIESISEREITLPAGPALEVSVIAQPGTPDAGQAVVCAIATKAGMAVIRFVGPPTRIAERAEETRLMAFLFELGLDVDD